MKFRIIKLIHDSGSKDAKTEFVIEQKTFFGWKEVFQKEIDPKRISHPTFEDAEKYLLTKYTGHGITKKNGNEYTYESYTYYV